MTAIRVLGRCGAEQKPESKSAPENKDLIRGTTKRRDSPYVRNSKHKDGPYSKDPNVS